MKRDILIGILAGLVALVVMNWRREDAPVPAGIYQATLNQTKYRELEQSFAARSFSTLETRKRLETRIDKFEVEEVRFDWTLRYLADVSGVDIDAEWSEMVEDAPRDWTLSLKLYDVPVIQILREVLATVGRNPTALGMRIEPGRVLVSLADRLNREQVTRVYDVRDLLRSALDPERALHTWKGPPATLPAKNHARNRRNPLDWLDFVVTEEDAVTAIVQFVQDNIDRTTWREAGGVSSVYVLAGKLVVVQSRENQDQIAELLDWMRGVLR